MSNAKSNVDELGVTTTSGPMSAYADGVNGAVPFRAYSVTVSIVLSTDAEGRLCGDLHAANRARPAAAVRKAADRQREGIRWESTGHRPHGSTHGPNLTSPCASPRLAAVWRRSGTWSKR